MSGRDGLSQLELLRAYGIRPIKKRGQNFLVDGNMARAIAVDVMALGSDVVELGAGGGALTRPLLEAGGTVLAVEVDRHLCALLQQQFASCERFVLREDDIARLDWGGVIAAAGEKPVLAGNLPYVLTSEVLFALADHREKLAGGLFMVQREVAQRLTAEPGGKDYGVLAVLLGSLFSVDLVRTVPANVFWPRPVVVSAVVRLVPGTNHWARAEYLEFRDTVKILFQQRRKQIATILRSRCDGDAAAVRRILSAVDIEPAARPEQVDRRRLRLLSRRLQEEASW